MRFAHGFMIMGLLLLGVGLATASGRAAAQQDRSVPSSADFSVLGSIRTLSHDDMSGGPFAIEAVLDEDARSEVLFSNSFEGVR